MEKKKNLNDSLLEVLGCIESGKVDTTPKAKARDRRGGRIPEKPMNNREKVYYGL